MEDPESVVTLMDSTTSRIQQLQKAFAELESHRAVTLNLKWKELEEHFHGLERSLKRRFHELEDQEREYETKTRKAQEMLEKREAAVMAKEQASLKRLQEKRDAAVFAITNALEKHRKVSSVEPAVVTSDVQELVKLKQWTQKGAQIYIRQSKEPCCPEEEIPLALKAAENPAQLVLNSLDDFYPMEVPNFDGKKDSGLLGLRRTCIMLMECLSILLTYTDLVSISDVISEDIKEQAKAIAEEWKPKLDDLDVDASNGNSLEAHAFLQLLATFGIASDFDEEELSRLIPMVSRRRQAAVLCRFLGLSEKMPGVIEVLVNSGRQIDAVNLAFAFELTEQFSPVPLLKSYLKEARKISSPVKPGNASPITAVCRGDLLEFCPLLMFNENDVNERELTALKAVIKCIEEHKLEEQYPVDPLQKRLIQLEKAKADKKRATEVAKPQPKNHVLMVLDVGPVSLTLLLTKHSILESLIASEALITPTEQVSDKINLESILVSIDDFFNRNPFFVAGCTFIWLVVIPLTEQYLRKYKFISAIDAFRKLRQEKDYQLLDIRDKKSLVALRSPNLKILNKSVVQVEFSKEDEDGFVKNVLEKFPDPATPSYAFWTIFDGNSMRVAELLFKNGFKEAYAIRGGVRGKKGWMAIQETLLPPSVHIYLKKKKSKSSQLGINGGVGQQSEEKNGSPSTMALSIAESQRVENVHKPVAEFHTSIKD
ncbi:hypothetical protein GH714_029139 [Hevea brasiliensis]|uniref:FRIGIDA-like protein n=1 Tax=Hevea brasiliensis TaxID=3981 RepID=A0A6A6KB41_HEVBR|nr:hypothetical protein GH714_029139 [Hevea brasiliensis]